MLETSGQLITLDDVAFGDVLVCSGQSTMVLLVRELKEGQGDRPGRSIPDVNVDSDESKEKMELQVLL